MAPPTQQQQPAGKFKPRQQPQRIRPGAATASSASAGVPVAIPTSSATSAAQTSSAAPSRSSFRGGGRGRGRGGRGRGRGRGRGDNQAPQGPVFFTGTSAASASTSAIAIAKKRGSRLSGPSSAGAAVASATMANNASGGAAAQQCTDRTTTGHAAARESLQRDEEEEVVVGTLDQALGAAAGASPSPKQSKQKAHASPASEGSAKQKAIRDKASAAATVSKRPSPMLRSSSVDSSILYDSDSSNEVVDLNDDVMETDGQQQLQPMQLPFPMHSHAALGIGGDSGGETTAFYPLNQLGMKSGETALATGVASNTIDRADPSPFVDPNDPRALEWEENEWSWVQLPTRLPPVKKSMLHDPMQLAADKDEDDDNEAPIKTPAVDTNAFDATALVNAPPGRIGKIQVHKSGKTVLVLEDEQGQPTICMNVQQGLTCGFRQEAVLIDPSKGDFFPMGTVGKKMIVTPDLSQAFDGE